MTETLSNNLINEDYKAAAAFYASQQPVFVGRQTISQQEAMSMPVDLGGIYQNMFETLTKEPTRAMSWARTFGVLSICVALDGASSNFKLDNASGFKPPNVAEVETAVKRPLQESLYAPEQDSSVTFLLAEGEDQIEMALIKALHMVDFGIVRRHVDVSSIANFSPLILTANTDELLKLRRDYTEARLRVYGNVRGMSDAFNVMGTVIPTSLLEASGISTNNLANNVPIKYQQVSASIDMKDRIEASMIGVTTAKRPHIGHAFLINKALASAGGEQQILVELNDLGPRVARGVAAYAEKTGISFDETAKAISEGSVTIAEIEAAYKVRNDNGLAPSLPPGFALAANNQYYQDLLSRLLPGRDFSTLANSQLEIEGLRCKLDCVDGRLDLFGGSGMSLLRDANTCEAVVIEKGGELTVAGVIGSMSTRYALTLVDSPTPLDRKAQKIFEVNGLGLENSPGMGVCFDFKVSSGTNGNTLLIDELVNIAETSGLSAADVLPACRQMLASAYFVAGDGASLNPNFASKDAAIRAFVSALAETDIGLLNQPMGFYRADKKAVVDMMSKVLKGLELRRKPDVQTVQKILEIFPNVSLGDELVDFVANHPDAPFIPKNVARSSLNTWNKISSQNPQFIFGLLEELAISNPDGALEIISGTAMEQMMQGMGYDPSDTARFFAKLKGVKDVFRIKQ